jgi:hypothetical protein
MKFDSLDRYLLDGTPAKAEIVTALMAERPGGPAAAPFYEGMRILGARTPELTLVALRLVLAGKTASDANVVHLRKIVETARSGGAAREQAVAEFREALGEASGGA